MKVRHVAPACAVLLLAACDSLFGPKTFEEAMQSARAAYEAKDLAKASRLCQRALELADKVGNGFKAISALDCIADAAFRQGEPARALPAFATVIGTYDEMLKGTNVRFRIRNNHGVALHQSGKKAEGIKALEEALDAWEGTPYATTAYGSFPQRMLIVANLARAAVEAPDGAVAARLSGDIADEIAEKVTANAGSVQFLIGATGALDAIATLAGKRGERARAGELAAMADELRAAEIDLLARHPRMKPECEQVGARGANLESCFQKVP